ncbi:MAG: phosphoribosylformylglycinamidine synthase [Candidatus Margulisbacteria bacterium GWF2_35_9]|nr:MAG: phosphoribosylformylglycinamidine synthase [Candidatus Margulisbacteria bacterium GWF2_35_9]
MYKVKVHILLKDDVLDPQGKTVSNALENLGFIGVSNMRIGKFIEFTSTESDEKRLSKNVKEMCEKVLANTVIEKYDFSLERIQ